MAVPAGYFPQTVCSEEYFIIFTIGMGLVRTAWFAPSQDGRKKDSMCCLAGCSDGTPVRNGQIGNGNDMETLCRIRDIWRAVAVFESALEKEHNLCMNEGMLLCTLSKTDRLSSSEIAESLGLTASNASKVIKSVENKGMVGRVLGETDKRQMYFSLTEKGRQALSDIQDRGPEIPALLQEILGK